jgi:hypothetical protein
MEGADISISVEMIEKFYAEHIKTMLDASATNVQRAVLRRERAGRQGGGERPARTGRQARIGVRSSSSIGSPQGA